MRTPSMRGTARRGAVALASIGALMLGQGAVARALRRVEAALMRRAGLVVLSSPAFAARYLGPHGQPDLPALLGGLFA